LYRRKLVGNGSVGKLGEVGYRVGVVISVDSIYNDSPHLPKGEMVRVYSALGYCGFDAYS
jgi:hypothetical protein